MLKLLSGSDLIVSEFSDLSSPKYMFFSFGKKLAIFNIGDFTSTIALDAIACTIANFENLSTHVRKRVPYVENISMWSISIA